MAANGDSRKFTWKHNLIKKSYLKRLKLMLKAPERQNWCRYTFYNRKNLKIPHYHHLDILYSRTNRSGISSQNWECRTESNFYFFALHIKTCPTSVYISNDHFPHWLCNPWSTMPTCVNICKISMISRKKFFQITFRMAVHTPNFIVSLEFLNEQSKISWLLMQKFH